jgi:hypothetical protein
MISEPSDIHQAAVTVQPQHQLSDVVTLPCGQSSRMFSSLWESVFMVSFAVFLVTLELLLLAYLFGLPLGNCKLWKQSTLLSKLWASRADLMVKAHSPKPGWNEGADGDCTAHITKIAAWILHQTEMTTHPPSQTGTDRLHVPDALRIACQACNSYN